MAGVEHPVRVNLELTAGLRDKVEHRYERGLQIVAYGFTQALTINFEKELVSLRAEDSIADKVHLPISLSAFTQGRGRNGRAQAQLPKRLRDWIIDYRAGLSDQVNQPAIRVPDRNHAKFAPKSVADMAIEFVRLEDLTPEELEAYEALNGPERRYRGPARRARSAPPRLATARGRSVEIGGGVPPRTRRSDGSGVAGCCRHRAPDRAI